MKELRENLKDLTKEEIDKVIIAYEPIWSIGTGEVPEKYEIEEVFSFIKKEYQNNKLLYGGSITEKTGPLLKNVKNLNGFLIGGLSLHLDKLEELINNLE